ncbi:unnamed protein product [Phaedon cochleariae]|uniref:MADF domain-containing protein n=1 Tax=Phaedon cochleariae TaxID=80249 RepID=A0A9P0DDN3_PHACE|nr:unnamed protein product [Phaedon cochleariae]
MDDGLLIEQVEKFRHIYDKRSSLFKNKLARENAWKTIGHILECDAEQCEQRWNVLRNKYAALKRQKPPSGSQASTVSWPYFDAMKFLDPFTLTRVRRISSLKQSSQSSSSTQSSSQSDLWPGMYEMTQPDIVVEELDGSQIVDAPEEELENIAPSSPAPNVIFQTPTIKRKYPEEGKSLKKKNDPVAESMSMAFNSLSDSLNSYVSIKNQLKDIDPSDKLFGESIAADLSRIKRMSEKMFVKQQIYSFLHEYFNRVERD